MPECDICGYVDRDAPVDTPCGRCSLGKMEPGTGGEPDAA